MLRTSDTGVFFPKQSMTSCMYSLRKYTGEAAACRKEQWIYFFFNLSENIKYKSALPEIK